MFIFTLGCGVGSSTTADLADPEVVRRLSAGSAPNAFLMGWAPIMEREAAEQGAIPACPAREDRGSSVRYTGGCTDDEGVAFEGSMTLWPGNGALYEGWTRTLVDEACGEESIALEGQVGVLGEDDAFTFEVDLVATGASWDADCEAVLDGSFQWIVDGSFEQGVWAGQGRVASSQWGSADVSTEAELFDADLCTSEALSGRTVLNAAGRTAVLTYDGEDDCDPEGTVTWTLDGEEQGELSGVGCASAPGAGWLAGWLVGSLALTRRRR